MLSALKPLAPSRLPGLKRLSPRVRRWVVWGAGLWLFYTMAGFLIVPPIVRAVAASQLAKQLNRKVSIAKVKLNPYTMSATIRGLVIQDTDGQPFLSWEEVYANFQPWSLLTRTFVFKEVRTTLPFVRVRVNPDYTLNFSDILDKLAREAASKPKESKPAKPRGLRVDRLEIAGARASLTDLTTKTPFTKMVGPLELTLQHFATNPDNENPYSFTGSTQDGEKFSWSGHFFLDPIRSIGEFAIEDVSLTRYAPLYQDLTEFEIRDGVLGLRAGYHVEQGTQTNLALLTNASISVRSLKLAEAGLTNQAFEIPELDISGANLDAFGRSAQVESIRTRGGRLEIRRNADASINFVKMAQPNPAATNTAGSIAVVMHSLSNVVDLLLHSTNALRGSIQNVEVADYAVAIEDLSLPRPVRVDLDQIQARVQNISNLPGTNLTAEAQMRWNTNGTIKTSATIGLFPINAVVDLAVDGLEIGALDPYLDAFFNLRIRRGQVGVKAQARLNVPAVGSGGLPQASFRGDLWVHDFATVDGRLAEDFIECKDLRISGLEATLQPLAATIQEVSLRDARARLVIDSEKTNNLFTVLRKTKEDTGLVSTNSPSTHNASSTPAGRSGKPFKIEIPTNLIASAQATLPKITLATLSLTNIHLDYLDRSLQPAVVLSVDDLGGTITGISTEDLSRADLQLSGKVGKAAPMEVTGKINLLAKNDYTDVKVQFKGIELLPTSPYAGKFLGYRLTKGKLSLDVHYQLADGKLKGQNLVTLDQLTLGQRVESPDALKLPIKLGLAILKDRSGRIELDVPVEGSLADPEFRLGRVITRALLNVFTKIVTSPFSALGGLFGGKGEEVRYQDFAPGSNELPQANREKLDALVKGLYERPGLQLEIETATDPVSDRNALRRLKLQKQFRTEKWSALRKAERARLTAEEIEVTPEEYQTYVAVTYARLASANALPSPTNRPAAAASSPGTAPSATKTTTSDGSAKGATVLFGQRQTKLGSVSLLPDAQDLEAQVLQTIEVTENDLAMLAAERARRIKEYILQSGQVEAERVLIAERPDDTNPAKGNRAMLHLR